MRRPMPIAALLGLLISGCGSGAKTVTVVSTPQASTTATTQSAATETTTTSTQSTSTAAPPPASTSTTRTAPEPSFTEGSEQRASGSVGAAVAVLDARGYTPSDIAEYHSGQTLRVLVGTRTGSADGYGQQAFFFLDGRYLGTDTKEPSAKISVVSQSDTEVTIAYPLYRSSDSLCCPSGGRRLVHFALDDGKLSALDPIPPASSKSGLARN